LLGANGAESHRGLVSNQQDDRQADSKDEARNNKPRCHLIVDAAASYAPAVRSRG
jgi:hypothetical protein